MNNRNHRAVLTQINNSSVASRYRRPLRQIHWKPTMAQSGRMGYPGTSRWLAVALRDVTLGSA